MSSVKVRITIPSGRKKETTLKWIAVKKTFLGIQTQASKNPHKEGPSAGPILLPLPPPQLHLCQRDTVLLHLRMRTTVAQRDQSKAHFPTESQVTLRDTFVSWFPLSPKQGSSGHRPRGHKRTLLPGSAPLPAQGLTFTPVT